MKLKTKRKTLLNEKQLKAIQKYSVIHYKTLLEDGKYLVEYTKYSQESYETIVNELIAEKYTIQDELAIHRKHQKGVNVDEFNEYDNYVEDCKARAKAFIDERTSVIGR